MHHISYGAQQIWGFHLLYSSVCIKGLRGTNPALVKRSFCFVLRVGSQRTQP